MISENNTIIKVTSNDLTGRVVFDVQTNKEIKNISVTILFNNKVVTNKESKDSEFIVNINNPQFWSVNRPNLYSYEMVIDYGNDKETIKDRFGIRKISTNKKYVCINDTPIFVKGYIRGVEAHDHKNNCGLTEEEFYRKNIKTAKSFGFNLVRFHSTIPSETFFKVADEEGILVHIEMRPPHDIYNNLEEMINTRNDFISEEFICNTVNSLYNHPSLLVYCLGNEIKNLSSYGIVIEIGEHIKKLDNTRLFLDTCAWGENSRPLVDLDVQHMSYYFPFGVHKDMYDDVENLRIGDFNQGKEIKFDVPLFAHEACHYTALRDFKSLKEKFNKYGVTAPWWVDEELKMIHAKGFDDEYEEMYHASKKWQLNCWKIAFEAMRNSTLLGGFHFLQFADTDKYENSNGVVDCFDDPNYITPEEFLRFNGDIIVTAKLDKYNFLEQEKLCVPVNVSRFDELTLNKCDLVYKLVGKTSLEGVVKDVDVSKHDHYQICSFDIKLPEVDTQEEYTLNISLVNGEEVVASNSYVIYVYPQMKSMTYEEFTSINKDKVVVTKDIQVALDSLKEGKNVCLVYRSELTRHVAHKDMTLPEYGFEASWNRFKPVIWDRGTNFGGIYNKTILSKHGIINSNLNNGSYELIEDSDKIILDNIPGKVTNLISGIDKCNRDRFDAYKGSFNLPELMYDRTLRNYSYMFEVKVGSGKLLVTGLNFTHLDENEVSNEWFAKCIVDYLSSDAFNPEHTISLEDLTKYLKHSAKNPIKERMMTQFWALDDTPVETKQYWIDSREYLKK